MSQSRLASLIISPGGIIGKPSDNPFLAHCIHTISLSSSSAHSQMFIVFELYESYFTILSAKNNFMTLCNHSVIFFFFKKKPYVYI